MFSKKQGLTFKSYFYFLPRSFSFSDSKFLLFPFNVHKLKIKYINEGEAKLAFSTTKHNFLTTPPFLSLYNNSFILLLLNVLFQPRSQGSLLPTSTERQRGRERESGLVWPRAPQHKINHKGGILSQFFCLLFFCHQNYWSQLPFPPFAMIAKASLLSLQLRPWGKNRPKQSSLVEFYTSVFYNLDR